MKQGSTQPDGHSFQATTSMCWLGINAVVPNDTKVVGALKRLLHPDRRGLIPQSNGSAFEVFDAIPCTDKVIEHVFHRFE